MSQNFQSKECLNLYDNASNWCILQAVLVGNSLEKTRSQILLQHTLEYGDKKMFTLSFQSSIKWLKDK
jgi:hypothetical protein